MQNVAILEARKSTRSCRILRHPGRRAVPLGSFAALGRGVASAAEWLFGLVSLVVGLSILAALPLLQFLSLGYFLESSARVARTGRLRDGLIGVRGPRGSAAWRRASCSRSIPAWLAGSFARTAELIDPGGGVAGAGELGWSS